MPATTDDKWLETANRISSLIQKDYSGGLSLTAPIMREGGTKLDLTRIEYGSMATTEQLVMAEAYMQVVADRIKSNGHEVPKKLADELDKCSRDLALRLRSERQSQLASLKKQREELLSADEKRGKLEAEIAKLEELLK